LMTAARSMQVSGLGHARLPCIQRLQVSRLEPPLPRVARLWPLATPDPHRAGSALVGRPAPVGSR
jgi:hypothetical protein